MQPFMHRNLLRLIAPSFPAIARGFAEFVIETARAGYSVAGHW